VNINPRQQQVLLAVIHNYIECAEPTASKTITENYDLGVSPATVRAEMLWLEENGYLYQPHTSAGRVPTDKGYRFYVDRLMQVYNLNKSEQQKIEDEYRFLSQSVSHILQKTVRFVSDLLECSTMITSPDRSEIYASGTTQLIHRPDFNDVGKIRNVLDALEEKQKLIDMLNEELGEETSMLRIGAESNTPKLADCSVIVTRYNYHDRPAGIISLITTKRTRYDKVTSSIHAIVEQIDQAFDRLDNY
jgi:transcriptional regulator of heat shock response